MLAPMSALLALGRPVAAFSCYDLETGVGAGLAAEQRQTPVVLLVPSKSLGAAYGLGLVAALVQLVKGLRVPGCVQLDHITEITPQAQAALDLGARAAMIDLSSRTFADNVVGTLAAVRAGQAWSAEIEGEIGRLDGDEDKAAAGTVAQAVTDVDEAVEFVARTGVCCLAVSVGNQHGPYLQPPHLDFELLGRLVRNVGAPIALHGTSGLPATELYRAVQCGVAKVNVNSDLRRAYLAALGPEVAVAAPTLDLLRVKSRIIEAVREVVDDVLGRLNEASSGAVVGQSDRKATREEPT